MRGFRNNVLENLDSGATAPPAFVIPEIRAVKYFAASQFAGIAEIERSTAEIREEFVALAGMRSDISHRLSGLHGADNDTGREGAWSMIPLMRWRSGVGSQPAALLLKAASTGPDVKKIHR